jgi:hypothetical protein
VNKLNADLMMANVEAETCSWYCRYCMYLTYSLTPWSRVLLEKLTGLQLVKKFPSFYRTQRFITALTSASHLSLSWASSITVSRGSISHMFRNKGLLRREVVSTSPNPQAGEPPRVGCPRLLIQYIRSYPPNWRPFLHPQPEDAPCRGDRDFSHGLHVLLLLTQLCSG